MNYYGVNLAVTDVQCSQKFYEALFGLEVESNLGENISFYGGLHLQEKFQWVIKQPKSKIVKESHNMALIFEEDDFDAFLEKLSHYPEIRYLNGGVRVQDWGQRVVQFYDLDGHIIEVGENFSLLAKRMHKNGMTVSDIAVRMSIAEEEVEKLLRVPLKTANLAQTQNF